MELITSKIFLKRSVPATEQRRELQQKPRIELRIMLQCGHTAAWSTVLHLKLFRSHSQSICVSTLRALHSTKCLVLEQAARTADNPIVTPAI